MATKHPLAAVLGMPAAHSLSPVIHGYWLEKLGIPGTYMPIEIMSADLADFFVLAPRLGFAGFNVTAPHKESAFKLCTETSATAARAGSVNLVVFRPDGTLFGDSTDGFGFLENLRVETGFAPAGRSVAIIGAGGAARAIVEGLVAAGAKDIRLANRTRARADAIAAMFPEHVRVFDGPAIAPDFYAGADLIIHASAFGMKGKEGGEKPWALPELGPNVVAAELIYAPLETTFLRDASAAGARVVDGLGMLLHQARPCFEAWFGQAVSVDEGLRARVIQVLDERAAQS